jgi:hypothetical protein
VLEDLFLAIERCVESWSSIQANFTDIARLREILLPDRNFIGAVGYKLRMES